MTVSKNKYDGIACHIFKPDMPSQHMCVSLVSICSHRLKPVIETNLIRLR